MRPSLISLEIELLEILNGSSQAELNINHLICQDHLGQLGLIERVSEFHCWAKPGLPTIMGECIEDLGN